MKRTLIIGAVFAVASMLLLAGTNENYLTTDHYTNNFSVYGYLSVTNSNSFSIQEADNLWIDADYYDGKEVVLEGKHGTNTYKIIKGELVKANRVLSDQGD